MHVGGVVLLPHTLALAVDEQLGLGRIGIDEHRRDLTFATRPCPVRQDVQCLVLLVPFGAVEPETVLGKRREVEDAEV